MRTKFKEFKGTKAEWIAVGTWVEVEEQVHLINSIFRPLHASN